MRVGTQYGFYGDAELLRDCSTISPMDDPIDNLMDDFNNVFEL